MRTIYVGLVMMGITRALESLGNMAVFGALFGWVIDLEKNQ